MAERTCGFCAHAFQSDARRRFCFTCLPPLGEWANPADYSAHYNLLYRATGANRRAGPPASRLPAGHPARAKRAAPANPLLRSTCEHCGAEVEAPRLRRFCSKRCASRAGSRRQRQRRKIESRRSVTCATCMGQFVTTHQTQKRCPSCIQAFRDRPRLRELGTCHWCGGKAARTVCDGCRRVSHRESNRRYKVRKRGARIGEPYTLRDVAERDRWRCQLCGKSVKRRRGWPSDPDGPSIDHVLPVSLGGEDSLVNVQLAHFGCNAAKRDGVWGTGEQLRLC